MTYFRKHVLNFGANHKTCTSTSHHVIVVKQHLSVAPTYTEHEQMYEAQVYHVNDLLKGDSELDEDRVALATHGSRERVVLLPLEDVVDQTLLVRTLVTL